MEGYMATQGKYGGVTWHVVKNPYGLKALYLGRKIKI
jgi:hypothetical protein